MKTYMLQVRVQGTQHKLRLGRHGVVTADQARYDARVRLADLQRGIVVRAYPAASHDVCRASCPLSRRACLDEEEGLQPAPRPHQSAAASLAQTGGAAARHHHARRGHGPAPRHARDAGHCQSSLESVVHDVRAGQAVGAQGTGQSRGRRRPVPRTQARYHADCQQRRRVLELLDQFAGDRLALPSVLAVIRVLLFTGARPGELLTLTWDRIDWEARLIRLADSKVGPQVLYLSDEAVATLAGLEQTTDWVFPGRGGKRRWSMCADVADDSTAGRAACGDTTLRSAPYVCECGGGAGLFVADDWGAARAYAAADDATIRASVACASGRGSQEGGTGGQGGGGLRTFCMVSHTDPLSRDKRGTD